MALRNRNGIWNYRFKLDGKEYSGTTDLAATKQNMRAAQDKESEHRQGLREGRRPLLPIQVREFNEATRHFLDWAKMEYRAHPNSYRRIATSLTSAKQFFGKEPVSLIDSGRLEEYKAWRVNDHECGTSPCVTTCTRSRNSLAMRSSSVGPETILCAT